MVKTVKEKPIKKEAKIELTTPTIEELFTAGAHFGHTKEHSHPRAYQFSYCIKNKIVVIDLDKTIETLNKALAWLKDLAKEGKTILFVGTKKQAQTAILKLNAETGFPYIVSKWMGGTMTNFSTQKRNLKKIAEIEADLEGKKLSKKDRGGLENELAKLKRLYGGIMEMNKLPDAIFVIDAKQEKTALLEAKILGIPTGGIVDTNANPDLLDYPIIANDDSIKTIEIVMGLVSDTVKNVKIKDQKEKITLVPSSSRGKDADKKEKIG